MTVKAWKQAERRRSNLDSFRMMSELWPEPKPVKPSKPKQRSIQPDVLIEEVAWLLENGSMPFEVAATFQKRQDTLARWMYRNGRPDLAARLDPERRQAA